MPETQTERKDNKSDPNLELKEIVKALSSPYCARTPLFAYRRIVESSTSLTITLGLNGVQRDSIEVLYEGGALQIKGSPIQWQNDASTIDTFPREPSTFVCVLKEGVFQVNELSAVLHKAEAMLVVTVPKTEAAQDRTFPIMDSLTV